VVAAAGAAALRGGHAGGAVLAGCVLAVAGLFEVMSPSIRGAARIGATTAAARRVREIECAQPRIVDPPRPQPLPPRGTLTLREVHFRHEPRQPLLEGVSLVITPGERVVLHGASGSGKSTLLSLVLRLHDPDSGSVCWDGVDLRGASLAELRRRIVLLPQDPPVFLGTVRDNLRIGDPGADDDALWNALREAGLEHEIRALPSGLDQWLGEAGRTLSAGQARRLCLARVLLSDAALVVLDEPTEGLDPGAERAFFLDLPRILRGRGLLLSTHAEVPPGVADTRWRLQAGRLQPA
jgi:ATP-binding cassette subfamily C protein CydC